MKIGIHIKGEALLAALEVLAGHDRDVVLGGDGGGRNLASIPYAADTGDLALGRLSLTEAGLVAKTVRSAAAEAWELATATHEAQDAHGFSEGRQRRAERLGVLAGILDTEAGRLGELVKRAAVFRAGETLENGEPPADFYDPEHGKQGRPMSSEEVDDLVRAIASSREGGDHGER